MNKWKHRCGWKGAESDLLTAPSPFDATDTLVGCPECKGTDDFDEMCAMQGCERDATCGALHPDGVYRRTCYEHWPK